MKKFLKAVFICLCFWTPLFSQNSGFDRIIKYYQDTYNTKDIIVAIMDANTGKILYTNDNKKLSSLFYFEASMRPIYFSIALDKKVVKNEDMIDLNNQGKKDKDGFYDYGTLKLKEGTIKDGQKFKSNQLSVKDVFVNISYIGITKIFLKVKYKDYINYLEKFGFKDNMVKKDLPSKFFLSYGYGIPLNLKQLMDAYSVFINDGYLNNQKVLDKDTANNMKDLIYEKYNKFSEITWGHNLYPNKQGNNIFVASNAADSWDKNNNRVAHSVGFVTINEKKYVIGVVISNMHVEKEFWFSVYPVFSSSTLFTNLAKEITLQEGYLSEKEKK